MARATTKDDLVSAGNTTFETLTGILAALTEEQRDLPFSFDVSREKGAHWARDSNVHDVLIHLHEWHLLLLDWVSSNLAGEEKPFLKAGYNWKTYGAMNAEFTERNRGSSYAESFALVCESHVRVMTLIDHFSQEELFTRGAYPWVGGTTLGSYFTSVTASHYVWATKKVRKFAKSLDLATMVPASGTRPRE
ncbi:DfsB family protein [Mycetocola tolaasinivorans]|uniref:DfsB family protein n=1 Tax=Mycetocola tolaasinivorans TaxID=76635 RepID=A0A3L7A3N7_9MICO|nr:ClbS/DfsB family four-helix bundle protein [Mycetocola tolaasinivorans]RLP74936.1 DfsB family protein [Mycetocola tolaasinivorans]